MGERHATAPPALVANDTDVTLGDLLKLLADTSAHAYAGDRARALHTLRRALALLEEGLPANARTAEITRLKAQADPATVAAFHTRRGAA